MTGSEEKFDRQSTLMIVTYYSTDAQLMSSSTDKIYTNGAELKVVSYSINIFLQSYFVVKKFKRLWMTN